MIDKDGTGQLAPNVARLDLRRARPNVSRDKPKPNAYVERRPNSKTQDRMLPNGESSIDFDDGFRVGEFEVYPKRLTLVGNGTTTRLEPKVMAVLVYLAQRADEVVTRNEFADEVWRGRIVSDEVLSRDISILRSQLGDDAKEPRYVLTVPRVGYRLIAEVRPLRDPEPVAALPSSPDTAREPGSEAEVPASTVAAMPQRRPDRRRMLLVTVAAAVTAVLFVWYEFAPQSTLDPTHIAVLPFASLSDAQDDEFFSDGLSEEIMHALGGVAGIDVVAKTSSFAFRDSKEDVREIGRRLNAGSLVEGSVRRDGNLLRITAQMIDANTGLQVWSQTYDRRLADIFEIQNQISTTIAHKLIGTLSAEPVAAPTQNIEAYTLFLRANHLLRQRGITQIARAIELYQQAIAVDPEFTRAWRGLAEAYTVQPSYSGTSELAGHRLALDALQRAEALGADPASLSAVRGYLNFRSRKWQAAKDDFAIAAANNPNDAETWQWYSQYFANVGWLARSREAAAAAVKADPLSPAANQRAGVVSLWSNDAAAASRYFGIAREVGIERPGLPEARIAYLLSEGRIDEVKKALFETQRARSQSTRWIEPTLAAIARTGPTQVALDALTDDYRAGRLGVSMFVDALFVIGDANGFYDAIQAVVASGEPFDVEVLFSETATALRRDARFIPLMEQLQLVEFWDAAGWPDLCQRAAEQVTCT